MDGFSNWIYPSTTIGSIIRIRPGSLEIFYRRNINPWKLPDETLSTVCARNGWNAASVIDELSRLPVPEEGGDWERLPCFHLVDYLTHQHRELLHSDLPAIRCILEMPQGMAGHGNRHGLLTQSFNEFTGIVKAHMREEEDAIFPIILRNEYLQEHPEEGDGADLAAERLRAAAKIVSTEHAVEFAIDKWLEQARSLPEFRQPSEILENAMRLIRNLAIKLRRHGRLEREVLLPMATLLERKSGVPVLAA